jgi:hypothetical protein
MTDLLVEGNSLDHGQEFAVSVKDFRVFQTILKTWIHFVERFEVFTAVKVQIEIWVVKL